MAGQRRAGLGARARHDVERARRQARAAGEGGEGERGQAGLLGGLEDAGVAHGERAADRAADDLHRVVPGHDVARHPVGFAQGVDGVAVLERDRRAVHLVGRAAVEFQVPREGHRVGARLFQRLADVERLEPGEVVGVIEDQLPEPRQHPPALRRRRPVPHAPARAARAAAIAASISSAPPRAISASGDPSEGLVSGRRSRRRDPVAADQAAVGGDAERTRECHPSFAPFPEHVRRPAGAARRPAAPAYRGGAAR